MFIHHLSKFGKFFVENWWRNNLSKLTIFDPIFQLNHSAMMYNHEIKNLNMFVPLIPVMTAFLAGVPFRNRLWRCKPRRGLDRNFSTGLPQFPLDRKWFQYHNFDNLICLGCGWLIQPDAKPFEEPKQNTLRGPWHWLLVSLIDNQQW